MAHDLHRCEETIKMQTAILVYSESARIISATILVIFCVVTYIYHSESSINRTGRNHTLAIVFSSLVACTLFIWRAPYISYPAELNPDESQTLASAKILSEDPIPWRSVDTTTSGPLNSYVYMWTYAFGDDPTYLSKRVTSVLLAIITILCLELCAFKILGHHRSFLAVLPAVLFFAFSSGIDFVHASTEYLPGCMLSIALTFIIYSLKDETNRTYNIIIGIVLGLIPFAKLQASLLALFLGLFIVILIGNRRGWRSKELVVVIIAAISPALFFTVVTMIGGSFNDMIMRSFAQALMYKGDQWELSYFQRFQRLVRCSEELMLITASTTSLFIAAILVKFKNKSLSTSTQLAIAMSWFLIGVYSVVKSGFIFPHYLTLLVAPVSILLIVILSEFDNLPSSANIGLYTILPFLLTAEQCLRPDEHKNVAAFILNKPMLQDELSQYLAKELKKGDRLGIWGWTPKYFVESNTRSATRDLASYFLLIDRPYTLKYRETYTADLIASRPKIFIDTATDLADDVSFPPQDKRRYTCYEPLANFIDKNYVKIGEFTPRGYKVPILIFKLSN